MFVGAMQFFVAGAFTVLVGGAVEAASSGCPGVAKRLVEQNSASSIAVTSVESCKEKQLRFHLEPKVEVVVTRRVRGLNVIEKFPGASGEITRTVTYSFKGTNNEGYELSGVSESSLRGGEVADSWEVAPEDYQGRAKELLGVIRALIGSHDGEDRKASCRGDKKSELRDDQCVGKINAALEKESGSSKDE